MVFSLMIPTPESLVSKRYHIPRLVLDKTRNCSRPRSLAVGGFVPMILDELREGFVAMGGTDQQRRSRRVVCAILRPWRNEAIWRQTLV